MAVAAGAMAISAALLATCAPDVAPETIRAIIRVESGGNPLAIHINGLGRPEREPADELEAAALARAAMAENYTVDLGLMQINSSNLEGLGFTVEEMFEPCSNIRAGAAILLEAYEAAVEVHGEGQAALRAALSMYNTGSLTAGFQNGYVARYGSDEPKMPAAPAVREADPYVAETSIFTGRERTMETSRNGHYPLFTTDLAGLETPGAVVEVDPETAERMGAFEETALTEEEAWESNDDLLSLFEEQGDGRD